MGRYSELALRRALSRSRVLSSDVSAGFDPTYAHVFEKKNAAYLGRGMSFNKFTGLRGKGGSNDANAEYILAEYGMEVIDSGLPVLNMHALYELSSKADIYEAVRGYKAFLLDGED